VGSWARGAARPHSDVDLVILSSEPSRLLAARDWYERIHPEAELVRMDDYGAIQERRLRLPGGLEVEIGIGSPSWAETTPVDDGTRAVTTDGLETVYDPTGLLAALLAVTAAPPAKSVIAAFALEGVPVPIRGGQQTAWRAGSGVIKRLDTTPRMIAWLEAVLSGLDGRDDFRVAPPLRSVSGDLVVDGWTAWRYEPGTRSTGNWDEIIDVSRRFHAEIQSVPRPAFLDERDDRWAIADRVAWGELPAGDYDTGPVTALLAALRPIDAAPQLIHGDLTRNVLFADGLPPLVIDLSPYWRPPTTAAAIVVADALIFEGADSGVVDRACHMPLFGQYLLRALIFRIVTDGLAQSHRLDTNHHHSFRAATEIALDLAHRQARP
jgi:uncharacterized protein (TIGR02569 family)